MPFNSDTGREAGQHSSRAGIPNKDTSRRVWITSFLDDYTNGKIKEDFYSLSPGERLKIAVKLMEYDTPKLRTIDFNIGHDEKETSYFEIAGQRIPFETLKRT